MAERFIRLYIDGSTETIQGNTVNIPQHTPTYLFTNTELQQVHIKTSNLTDKLYTNFCQMSVLNTTNYCTINTDPKPVLHLHQFPNS